VALFNITVPFERELFCVKVFGVTMHRLSALLWDGHRFKDHDERRLSALLASA